MTVFKFWIVVGLPNGAWSVTLPSQEGQTGYQLRLRLIIKEQRASIIWLN
jgi:hypothetical protein